MSIKQLIAILLATTLVTPATYANRYADEYAKMLEQNKAHVTAIAQEMAIREFANTLSQGILTIDDLDKRFSQEEFQKQLEDLYQAAKSFSLEGKALTYERLNEKRLAFEELVKQRYELSWKVVNAGEAYQDLLPRIKKSFLAYKTNCENGVSADFYTNAEVLDTPPSFDFELFASYEQSESDSKETNDNRSYTAKYTGGAYNNKDLQRVNEAAIITAGLAAKGAFGPASPVVAIVASAVLVVSALGNYIQGRDKLRAEWRKYVNATVAYVKDVKGADYFRDVYVESCKQYSSRAEDIYQTLLQLESGEASALIAWAKSKEPDVEAFVRRQYGSKNPNNQNLIPSDIDQLVKASLVLQLNGSLQGFLKRYETEHWSKIDSEMLRGFTQLSTHFLGLRKTRDLAAELEATGKHFDLFEEYLVLVSRGTDVIFGRASMASLKGDFDGWLGRFATFHATFSHHQEVRKLRVIARNAYKNIFGQEPTK